MDTTPPTTPSDVTASGNRPGVESFDLLVTAEEAYPAFERAFLEAESEIIASFRVVDLSTRLVSPAARRIGRTWMELLVHTLDRGVKVRLIASDFDPLAAPHLHQLAWRTLRQTAAVRELARDDAKLDVKIALHDARTGVLPRMVFYPLVRHKMNKLSKTWKDMSQAERQRFKVETPRLQKMCFEDEQGCLRFPLRPVDLYPATHHQKMAVFDRKTLYIGGLDLNERRYDTKRHRRAAESTWHDIQALVTGPVVKAAQAHLESFLDTVADSGPSSATVPEPAPGFLRTLSRRRRGFPVRMAPKSVLREVEARHMQAISKARRLIYLETQFLRHMPLARALAGRARACPELRLIVVLPAAPEDIAFDSSAGLDARFGEHQQVRCLALLQRAFGPERFVVASPVQPRRKESDGRDTLDHAPLVYVHSKVSIFDDFGAIVSSANLNGRSMRWDTEAGLYLDQAAHVEEVRRRAMGHWLPRDAGPAYLAPDTAFANWRRLVETNSALPPAQRRGFLVRYDSDVARAVATPLPGMPEEVV
ncbi:phospholipase D-like domain-containing protein [Roseovarius sp. MMSF_3281]|uniref:phospholipase D family protein n=1 Tax=Roseovarius sp. MMSF_3281 TaxID=3046694 RepID=UPI00273ED07D|nr:phospholipase D-like domain-containing protein [Roseovarius sp. MMSF_3281]